MSAAKAALTFTIGALLALTPVSSQGGGGRLRVEPAASADSELSDEETSGGLPSLEALLKRYVLAVGGRDAILNLRTRTATLRCVTDLPTRTPPVYEVDSLSVWSRTSGEFLMVHRTPDDVIVEGNDGDELWRIRYGTIATSGFSWGPRDRWLTDPQFPLRLVELFPDMHVVGIDSRGGHTLYTVDIDGDISHRLGFDVDSGLLTHLGYNRELRDYREIDGVLMPTVVVISRKGGSSTFILDAVSHNQELDQRLFSLAR
jgi:hypothetical protein